MRRLFAGSPQRTDGRLTKNNLLDRTADAVTVAWGVGSDSFGVLYDMYPSITEGKIPRRSWRTPPGSSTTCISPTFRAVASPAAPAWTGSSGSRSCGRKHAAAPPTAVDHPLHVVVRHHELLDNRSDHLGAVLQEEEVTAGVTT